MTPGKSRGGWAKCLSHFCERNAGPTFDGVRSAVSVTKTKDSGETQDLPTTDGRPKNSND